jgi:tetratricopeptide (TPR) repeat protein
MIRATHPGIVHLLLAAVTAAASVASPVSAAAQAGDTRGQNQATLARIRGELFAGTSRPDEAIRGLKAILATEPDSAEAHLLLGIAYRTAGSADLMGEAVAELRQALALNPGFIPARYYLAHIYLDLGRYERAREELDAALADAPRNAQVLTLLGEVERLLRNPKRSLDVLKLALTIDASSAQAHYYVGLTLLDLGRAAEAIVELERVVRTGEKRAEVYLSLGAAYLESGRLDEGLEILSRATQIDAARPDIRLQLARAYRLKGMLDKADAQLKVAVPQGPPSVASPFVQQRQLEHDRLQELGLLRLAQGQLTAAAGAFQTLLDMDPEHGPTNRHLAEVYLRQGQYARALDFATRAENLGSPLPADRRKLIQDGVQKQKKSAGSAR